MGRSSYGGPFGEPACLTPLRDECAPGSTALSLGFIASKVLEAPFDVGPDLTWRPRLVSNVTVTTRPPITLTYHIRPEARWSDGVPITAADFVFTHQAILRSRPEDVHKTKVRSVRALDSKTVKVVLRSRFAGWRELFGSILPRHALAGVDLARVWTDRIENPKTGAPIGSGPFLVERWERGKQITLRRNPRYWGPHPAYLDRLVVRFQVQGPALCAKRSDGASWTSPRTSLRVSSPSCSRNLRCGCSRTNGRPAGTTSRSASAPAAIRRSGTSSCGRALAYGIDRAAIVAQVLRATDRSASQRDSAVFPTRSPHYRRNWERYRYRPAEARRLLEQAGCRRGADGIYVCAGSRLSLRFVTTAPPGGFRPRVIELVQAQLRQAGIEVVPNFATTSAIFDQILGSGDFDVALFSWISLAWRIGEGHLRLRRRAELHGLLPAAGHGRPRSGRTDPRHRQQARVLNRADLRMARDVPVIPLYQQTQSVAMRSTVRNFGLSLSTQLAPLWNAENWWLAEGR